MTFAKILFNSVVSTPNVRMVAMDVKDFYLNTVVKIFEYMRILLALISPEIVTQYNLEALVHTSGYIYIEIRKGMYGLPQAGLLAYQKLTKHLAKAGYRPTKHTPGIWTHNHRPIAFSLAVDNFRIKYTNKANAEHLLATLC